ncbi:MAG: hypothetical protein JWO37_1006 [Acidimicrobiales bacterium]|jgi:hypothetical protein|nr:hypothetical protein [Acidimicrobiales bacterium]
MRMRWEKGTKSRRVILAGCALGVLVITHAMTASASGPASSNRLEANLTNDASADNGEPSIAINPIDPSNIIVGYVQNYDAGMHAATYQQSPSPHNVLATIQSCGYAVTHDGGTTWVRRPIPYSTLSPDPIFTNCSDEIAAFTRDGVAYLMMSTFSDAFPAVTEVRLIASRDGGATWSPPSTALRNTFGQNGSLTPATPGLHLFLDRPWLTIDDSTGRLYVSVAQYWVDPAGIAHNVLIMTTSTSGGRTWSEPTQVDGPVPTGETETQYPPPTAGHGEFAMAYVAPAGATSNPTCRCVVFASSRDGGRTFTRRSTPFNGDPTTGNGISTQLVADPTRAAAFALMTVAHGQVHVSRTVDDGRTWSKQVPLGISGTVPWEPWAAFSPSGTLGVVWRAQYPDMTYDTWAATSASGGLHFAMPTRLNTRRSPAPNWYLRVGGDDTTGLALDAGRLIAAWGDWRGSHGEDVWWARVPTQGEAPPAV